ncbi:hypothetical protein [Anaerorhabdus sp.]|uniref:hypothetical protein n=1 Tax=Anaerorhabdus sp. TaxID=1872524 RepID=UPI002FCB9BEE
MIEETKVEVLLLNPSFKKEIDFIFKKLCESKLEKYEILFLRKFTTSKQLFFIYYTVDQFHEILTDQELEELSKCSGMKMRSERERLLQHKIKNSSEEERRWQERLGEKAGLSKKQRELYLKSEYTKEYMAVLRKMIANKCCDKTIKLLTQPGITKSYQNEIIAIYKLDSDGWNKSKDYLLDPLIEIDKLIEFRHCIKSRIPDEVLSTWREDCVKEIRNKRYEYIKKLRRRNRNENGDTKISK